LSVETEQLQTEIAKVNWYHSIPLGDGIVTPGVDDSSLRLPKIHLPEDLSGKTVLDVGAWDGFFSFEAERRGAERVLATDSFCWGGGGWGTKDGFELARRALDSKVEDHEIDVLDLSPETVGTFDVVLMLGILYHMKHPLLALEQVRSVTKERLIMSTFVDMTWWPKAAAAFYEGSEANRDPTNWWGPNPAAVVGMLRAAGFERIEIVDRPTLLRHRLSAQVRAKTGTGPPVTTKLWQGAMVCHAWV
jgi:tRNA (mo5U34)-methyltransferase